MHEDDVRVGRVQLQAIAALVGHAAHGEADNAPYVDAAAAEHAVLLEGRRVGGARAELEEALDVLDVLSPAEQPADRPAVNRRQRARGGRAIGADGVVVGASGGAGAAVPGGAAAATAAAAAAAHGAVAGAASRRGSGPPKWSACSSWMKINPP